jgi:hypothetical protein
MTHKALIKELERLLKRLDGNVEQLQSELASLIVEQVSARLRVVDGGLPSSTSNIAAVNAVDNVFDKSLSSSIKALLKKFIDALREMGEKIGDYFESMGFSSAKVERAANTMKAVYTALGIKPNGELLPNGFIYRLGLSQAVRDEIKNWAVQQLAGGKSSLTGFQQGLRRQITGNSGVDGKLASYWRQYAHDAFFRMQEVMNTYQAESLGLEFFIYEGSVIATTRAFCKKRAGKVFHVSEVEAWRNDPDLVDPKTRSSYQPLVELGRNNCRHSKRWITVELATKLRPDAAKFIKKV